MSGYNNIDSSLTSFNQWGGDINLSTTGYFQFDSTPGESWSIALNMISTNATGNVLIIGRNENPYIENPSPTSSLSVAPLTTIPVVGGLFPDMAAMQIVDASYSVSTRFIEVRWNPTGTSTGTLDIKGLVKI